MKQQKNMLEIEVTFYRTRDRLTRRVQLTEELLLNVVLSPEEMATRTFQLLFKDVWAHRKGRLPKSFSILKGLRPGGKP